MMDIYQEIVTLLSRGERAVLATVLSSQGSAPRSAQAKMLIRENGTSLGTIGGGAVELQICQKALEVLNSGKAQVVHYDLSGKKDPAGPICGGEMDILLEPISPPEALYLFGAGHISQSVAAMGKMLGFRIVVVDPRADFNNSARFPGAQLIVGEYAETFARLAIDKESYIVIVTHGHTFDEQCLQFAATTEARYIGMIGSKKKVEEVKSHLLKKGISQRQLDRVHAPVGLEIGAETPEEIAVSILAQIVQVRRGL